MIGRRAARSLAAALVGAVCVQWSSSRAAEPIEAALVVAGDAPGRLVLDYWPPAGWLVRQSGRVMELVLPGAQIAISSGAITLPAVDGAVVGLDAEITEEVTVLRVGLGCDCAPVVRGDGRRLVIDFVGDGRTAAPLQTSGPAPLLARIPRPRGVSGSRVSLSAPQPDVAAEVEEARSRLLRRLRQAAEAGFVELRPDRGGLPARLDRHSPMEGAVPDGRDARAAGVATPDLVSEDPGTSVARAAEPVTPVLANHAGPHQPGETTAMPGDLPQLTAPARAPSSREVRNALLATAPASGCVASEAFMLPDPMPPRAFVEEVSRLRRSLLGEFDRPDSSVTLDLARLYLGHGLGFEALQVLAEFAPAEPEAPLLAAISRLAEGLPLPAGNLLSVSGCDGQHALWQALNAALDGRPGEAVALLESAQGALEQVTHGLRGRVAVELGLAAARQGDWIAAHRLEAMADRALPASDRAGQEKRKLLGALVLRERGELARAGSELADLLGARSRAAAEALLVRAESTAFDAVNGAVPLERLRHDLGALVTAHRESPLGTRAFRAEVMATGRLMGRDAAFELLEFGRTAGLVDEAGYTDTLAEISAGPDGHVGDTPLAILYEQAPKRFARLRGDRDFRVALARSYLSLGTPALAERVLLPEDLSDERLREALAAGYLETGDGAAAERLTTGPGELSRRAADEPRQSGTPDVGRHVSPMAGAARTDAGESGRARATWAAGDWQGAVEAPKSAAFGEPSRASRNTEAEESASPQQAGNGAPGLALRLALAAKRGGLQAPPPEAVALVESEPGFEAGLRAIFAGRSGLAPRPSPEALARLLDEISAETRMYKEVMEDG